jgi:hypothetical protein
MRDIASEAGGATGRALLVAAFHRNTDLADSVNQSLARRRLLPFTFRRAIELRGSISAVMIAT